MSRKHFGPRKPPKSGANDARPGARPPRTDKGPRSGAAAGQSKPGKPGGHFSAEKGQWRSKSGAESASAPGAKKPFRARSGQGSKPGSKGQGFMLRQDEAERRKPSGERPFARKPRPSDSTARPEHKKEHGAKHDQGKQAYERGADERPVQGQGQARASARRDPAQAGTRRDYEPKRRDYEPKRKDVRKDERRPDAGAQHKDERTRTYHARPPRPAHAHKKEGDSGLLYGLHSVRAALGNPLRRCHRLLATENAAKEIAEAAKARRLSIQITDARGLDALLPANAVHQGVVLGTDPLPDIDIEELIARAVSTSSPIVCLDQISDPHNVGAILRSAAVFGAAGLVMLERNAPALTGVLAKSASGALEHVPVARVTNLARALEQISQAGLFVIGLDERGETDLASLAQTGAVALVLGAEGDGLRRLSRENCNVLARLPARGGLQSLNVSNAAAVALYEVTRR